MEITKGNNGYTEKYLGIIITSNFRGHRNVILKHLCVWQMWNYNLTYKLQPLDN